MRNLARKQNVCETTFTRKPPLVNETFVYRKIKKETLDYRGRTISVEFKVLCAILQVRDGHLCVRMLQFKVYIDIVCCLSLKENKAYSKRVVY